METINCGICGDELVPGTEWKVDGMNLCDACREDHSWTCDNCGDEKVGKPIKVELSPSIQSQDRNNRMVLLCETCSQSDAVFYCNDCATEYYDPGENLRYWIEGYDRMVCEPCRDDYSSCDWCEELVHNDDLSRREGTSLCESCREDAYICDNCGIYVHADDVHESGSYYYCPDCRPTDGWDEIDHSIRFIDVNNRRSRYPIEGVPYYGIEIEFDDCDGDRDQREKICDFVDRVWGCLKTDGSLNNGREVTLPPMSPDYLAGEGSVMIGELAKLINSSCQMWAAKTAGIHIHRDRGGVTLDTEAGLILLFYFHRERVSKLAGRAWDSWKVRQYASYTAQYEELNDGETGPVERAKAGIHKRVGRYCAVNCTPCETVEFRPFQSTGRLESIMGYFGLVHYSTLFSNEYGPEQIINLNNNGILWPAFTDYAHNYSSPLQGALTDHLKYRRVI